MLKKKKKKRKFITKWVDYREALEKIIDFLWEAENMFTWFQSELHT